MKNLVKFPYQVSGNIKRGIDSSFKEYKGCGSMANIDATTATVVKFAGLQ